jgi:molybdopterin converting factor subunit 1
MHTIRVLFFATLRDRAGMRSLDVGVPAGATVRELKQQLAAERPALSEALQSVLVAIDREYAPDEAVIPAGAEVAFFPPVSGG